MGSTTAHGFPFPTGSDRVMDGDNAIEALAQKVDDTLFAGQPATRLAPGVWADAGSKCFLVSGASVTQHPGSSTSGVRYMMIGNTVWLHGYGSVGTTPLTDAAVRLPNELTGIPRQRNLNVGSCVVMANTAQMYHAIMTLATGQHLSAVMVTYSNSYVDAPAGVSIKWNFCYEVIPLGPTGGTLPGPGGTEDPDGVPE